MKHSKPHLGSFHAKVGADMYIRVDVCQNLPFSINIKPVIFTVWGNHSITGCLNFSWGRDIIQETGVYPNVS